MPSHTLQRLMRCWNPSLLYDMLLLLLLLLLLLYRVLLLRLRIVMLGGCRSLVNNVVGGWVGLLYNMLCSTGSIRVKEVLARLTSVMENVVGSSARTSTAWLHNMLWSRAPSTWGHSHGNLSHLPLV